MLNKIANLNPLFFLFNICCFLFANLTAATIVMIYFRNTSFPLLLTILFISFLPKHVHPQSNYKLLLYVTLNDSIQLQKTDTTWLFDKNCLELKIDTIDINTIRELKKKENRFYYRDQIFWNTQLFDLNMYDALKKLSITGFSVSVAALSEPRGVFASSICLTNEQRKFTISYWKSHKERHPPNEIFWMTFDDIQISNTFGRKNIEYVVSILNGVVCNMR
jgi:hypothetical protein